MRTKKKVYIAYKFSGENPEELKRTIPQIHEAIEKAGHNHYSTFFDDAQFTNEKWSEKQIFQKAFKEIDESDLVLFFVNSSEISHGMLIELGYSLAKKKRIVLVIKKSITDIKFRRQIEEIIEFDNLEDLKKKLSNLKL